MNQFQNFGFRLMFTLVTAIFLIASVDTAVSQIAEGGKRYESRALIKIVIDTSRPKLTAGPSLGIGISARITNISDRAVYLRPNDLTLAMPGELGWFNPYKKEGINPYWDADFPTEPGSRKDQKLLIPPGDTYAAFWYVGRSRGDDDKPWSFWDAVGWLRSRLYFMTFVPGDYKFSVVGKYWTDPNTPVFNYRTIEESVSLPVAAPQFAILWGASIGGLIAYIIFPALRRRPTTESSMKPLRFLKNAVALAGSILMSIIVTILLSRISETQFLIKVTVNDLWGAIAIGFVANYGGAKILARLIPNATGGRKREKRG